MGISIEVRGISKSFGSGDKVVHALDNVSISVQSGEIYGFVGSNGAGKTTTMRIIMGVLSSDSGEVLLDGKTATTQLRQRIGYMPSERGLYPKMKLIDQLMFFGQLHGLSKTEAKIQSQHWIEQLGITQYRNKLVETLSTGNAQRAQLAVALMTNPDALILDEPFSGLDPVAVKVMSGIIREQAEKGCAIIFSSHQLELVDKLSDRVGLIKNGKIAHQGTPDQLREMVGAPKVIEVPTPLADIFADLIEDDNENGGQNA
jgi:ABC-2 type transport system ATP-binding protein